MLVFQVGKSIILNVKVDVEYYTSERTHMPDVLRF